MAQRANVRTAACLRHESAAEGVGRRRPTKRRSPVERYVDAAEAHGKGMDSFGHIAANRAFDRLVSARKQLRKARDGGRSAPSGLLKHHNVRVRHCAAVDLLPLDPPRALEALEAIVKHGGMVGLDAETTLSEWRAGRLKIEPE